jgi:hypothetical protein
MVKIYIANVLDFICLPEVMMKSGIMIYTGSIPEEFFILLD